MLLLEQHNKKGSVDEITSQLKFDNSRDHNEGQYKFETIHNSGVYTRELDDDLSGIYYLLS